MPSNRVWVESDVYHGGTQSLWKMFGGEKLIREAAQSCDCCPKMAARPEAAARLIVKCNYNDDEGRLPRISA